MIDFSKKHPSVRAKLIRSMEYLVRSLNDEELMEPWLMNGVADGDINGQETDEYLAVYYENDKDFAELMQLFLELMSHAYIDKSGLYCDGVASK